MVFHRRSIRLKGYDYSRPGAYFVTMVTQGREWVFGEIRSGELNLNDAGQMIARWWQELPCKFPAIESGAFVVMPNRFHGIIQITENPVGADLRVRPDGYEDHESQNGGHIGPPVPRQGAPLSQMMQWFKTMTTNEYIRGVKELGWQPFAGKLWQRSYYEHIIRNEAEWNRIHRYIEANPVNWKSDKQNRAEH